jgi:hypothetical protein
MADSDNSTSPSAVTRRRLLAGTMIAALPLPVAGGSTLEPASREIVLTLWRAWNDAHAETDVSNRRVTPCRIGERSVLSAHLRAHLGAVDGPGDPVDGAGTTAAVERG